ncbi:MAG: hypothetical protein IJ452_00810 [Butyricicoccus sp.]|nr:hypothetical protein [Butyricicoccus sp.]MBQ8584807.1 hypothetical protein [Butyricicoccus sp.]
MFYHERRRKLFCAIAIVIILLFMMALGFGKGNSFLRSTNLYERGDNPQITTGEIATNALEDSNDEVLEWPQAAETERENQSMQQAISEPSVSDPAVLPDFLANDSSGAFRMLNRSRTGSVSYLADNYRLEYIAEEYMKLLEKIGYKVVYEEDAIGSYRSGTKQTRRDFEHDGVNADILDSSKGQVCIIITTESTWNETFVEIFYSDGIRMDGVDNSAGS